PKYKEPKQQLKDVTQILANAPFKAEGEQIGVVAQELEKVAPYMVNKKAMGDMKDLREVNNQAYPFLLINAVKELAAENEELKKQVADIPALKNEIAAIKAMLTSSIAKTIAPISQQDVNFETAYLDQNIPNPPTGNFTKINYNIPNGTIKAELVITDNAGRKIKQISLNTFGKGLLNLDTKGLASGTYAYTMYVDGKIIDTKKMVVVK
ncbi:MAG TPA: T9SS type A sorting domain-containing protein, partial [Panacibacter sp.]|nr:T9SS type A sorting domain-containing protein [Panacibacter sp.]